MIYEIAALSELYSELEHNRRKHIIKQMWDLVVNGITEHERREVVDVKVR